MTGNACCTHSCFCRLTFVGWAGCTWLMLTDSGQDAFAGLVCSLLHLSNYTWTLAPVVWDLHVVWSPSRHYLSVSNQKMTSGAPLYRLIRYIRASYVGLPATWGVKSRPQLPDTILGAPKGVLQLKATHRCFDDTSVRTCTLSKIATAVTAPASQVCLVLAAFTRK
jgi:hypothetical protein